MEKRVPKDLQNKYHYYRILRKNFSFPFSNLWVLLLIALIEMEIFWLFDLIILLNLCLDLLLHSKHLLYIFFYIFHIT